MTSTGRYVVKPRFGSASKNISLNVSKSEAIDISNRLPDVIFQPFIEGSEFGIDAWVDKHNKVKGIMMRKRDLTIGGESKITTTFQNRKFERTCLTIFRHLKLAGPLVMQAIIDNKGQLNIVECNPRFGGASALSIRGGLDLIYWSLYESLGYDVDEIEYKRSNKEVRQVRVTKDMYKYGNNF